MSASNSSNSFPDVQQPVSFAAHASVVNRTHRVIRDQAQMLRDRRDRSRSLWAPLAICSTLLVVVCYAVWGLLNAYDVAPTDVPDSPGQLFLLLLWSLPVTAALLGMAWLRRSRRQDEVAP